MTSMPSDDARTALRAEHDSNMIFAAHAAHASGHLTDASTNWDLGSQTAENACDICKSQSIDCARLSLTDACGFCMDKGLQCVGPGNNRRARLYEAVDQTLPFSGPASGEYEIGSSVAVRRPDGLWNEKPHVVVRAIYRQHSLILDDQANPAITVDQVRPYSKEWVQQANAAQLASTTDTFQMNGSPFLTPDGTPGD